MSSTGFDVRSLVEPHLKRHINGNMFRSGGPFNHEEASIVQKMMLEGIADIEPSQQFPLLAQIMPYLGQGTVEGVAKVLEIFIREAGSGFQKLGPILGTLTGEPFTSALARAAEYGKAVDFSQIEPLIRAAAGEHFGAIEDIDTTPCGVGSIGQVHKCKVREDGERTKCVIKVVKPGAQASYRKNLASMRRGALKAENTPMAKLVLFNAFLDSLGSKVVAETDMTQELAAMLAVLDGEQQGDETICRPLAHMTDENVLFQTQSPGQMVEHEMEGAPEKDREKVAERIIRLPFLQTARGQGLVGAGSKKKKPIHVNLITANIHAQRLQDYIKLIILDWGLHIYLEDYIIQLACKHFVGATVKNVGWSASVLQEMTTNDSILAAGVKDGDPVPPVMSKQLVDMGRDAISDVYKEKGRTAAERAYGALFRVQTIGWWLPFDLTLWGVDVEEAMKSALRVYEGVDEEATLKSLSWILPFQLLSGR